MLPAIAKVVLVEQVCPRQTDQVSQLRSIRLFSLVPRELMQVGIGPAHYDLQCAVQFAERDIALNLEATLNRRSCTEQSDFDRVDRHDESHSEPRMFSVSLAIIAVAVCPGRKRLVLRKKLSYDIGCYRQLERGTLARS